MTSLKTEQESLGGTAPDRADGGWRTLKARLEEVKRGIVEQIANYPPPITACDAQFNYLLEERDKVSEELRGLEELRGEFGRGEDGSAAKLEAFVSASAFIDG